LIVLLFNFVFKRLLMLLSVYFKNHQKPWQESFVSALYVPLSYYVWYFALIETVSFVLQQLQSNAFASKQLFLSAGLVISFAWFLLRWKNRAIASISFSQRLKRVSEGSARIDVIDKLLTVTILLVSLMMLLEVTGSNLNTLVAFGGISGLALAFASQEVIASFFGGLMIYINQPFQIGDWIILPERSIEGHVEEIGWYTTRVRTFDKRPIYVPNTIFSKIVVVNPSRMSHRQIKETIGVRYRDMAELKGIIADIKQMLDSNPDVDHAMNCGVYFTAFGAYSLDILISVYTSEKSSDGFNRIKEKILFAIMDILSQHQAELAFPTTCVERSEGPSKGPAGDLDIALDAGGVYP
jgi:MscS family membrane protein